MDPCECMWKHEMAMRHLLSLLRQSQSACTDNECFSELPFSPGAATSTEDNSYIFMAVIWFAFAVILYFLRPRSLSQNDTKPKDNNGPGNNGRPSASPPSVN